MTLMLGGRGVEGPAPRNFLIQDVCRSDSYAILGILFSCETKLILQALNL